jgi:hypothetical protein
VARSDHNYDFGSLYLEAADRWRLLAPTEPGPEPGQTGGAVALWESRDEGRSWRRLRVLTSGSAVNHTYVRRPLAAHPDFWALWADGSTRAPGESRLYFTDRACEQVWRLPARMRGEFAAAERVDFSAGR